MLFTGYKKVLKQSNSTIDMVSSDKKENDVAEINVEQKIDPIKPLGEVDERTLDMSRTLIAYIGEAIEKWAQQYDMQKLPKNIVFKKALTLMNAWDKEEIFK